LSAAVVNTGAIRPAHPTNFRDAARPGADRCGPEHWASPTVFTSTERQDHMSNNEKSESKSGGDGKDHDAKRRARDKALDKALEESFPASDPVSPSTPAPTRD
jgi:hypothetical protein